MKRLLPLALALAGLGTALSACHSPETPAALTAPASAAPAATPAAPAATPTAVAPAPVALTPSAALPLAAPTVRRAAAAEAALVAEQHAARTPRLTHAQREAQQEAREEFERERAAKAQRIARYGSNVPEAGEREEHHDANERAEGKADGFDEPDQFIEYERSIRARIGGQPEYGAGYRVEAAQALDDTPAGRAAKAMSETPGAMAAQGIMAITEVGPGNVSGRTRVISPDPASPLTTWLVAGVDGGFWKTSNAGTSWTHVAPYLDYLAFASIARSPRDPNVLYAGTGEGFGNSDAVRGDGIFRSATGATRGRCSARRTASTASRT